VREPAAECEVNKEGSARRVVARAATARGRDDDHG
jgi:hypothetical protein